MELTKGQINILQALLEEFETSQSFFQSHWVVEEVLRGEGEGYRSLSIKFKNASGSEIIIIADLDFVDEDWEAEDNGHSPLANLYRRVIDATVEEDLWRPQ
jgi:hypothetical protein